MREGGGALDLLPHRFDTRSRFMISFANMCFAIASPSLSLQSQSSVPT
jgi:hypothetical protein